ncbi:MAG: ribonuclease P protein component [Saprospiraceae bacterium]
MPDFTFKRAERLKSRTVIEQLFKQGQSFAQYPLRLVWTVQEERQSAFPVQFALTVPKKKFKKAVQRNRIRRLVREAYRLNKHRLYRALEGADAQLAFLVIYTGQEALSFQEIEAAMQQMIRRFIKKWRADNQI